MRAAAADEEDRMGAAAWGSLLFHESVRRPRRRSRGMLMPGPRLTKARPPLVGLISSMTIRLLLDQMQYSDASVRLLHCQWASVSRALLAMPSAR